VYSFASSRDWYKPVADTRRLYHPIFEALKPKTPGVYFDRFSDRKPLLVATCASNAPIDYDQVEKTRQKRPSSVNLSRLSGREKGNIETEWQKNIQTDNWK